jgi:hypothetical protein
MSILDKFTLLYKTIRDGFGAGKMKIDENKCRSAVYSSPRYGPTFGGDHDIYIANNANSRTSSYSNLGLTYSHPEYEYESNEAKSFLAGSYYFQLSKIEIYKID